MSSDRMKRDYRGNYALDVEPMPSIRREDGRYVRFSHRYKSWQIQTRTGDWRNIRPSLARCYVAAGLPVGVTL